MIRGKEEEADQETVETWIDIVATREREEDRLLRVVVIDRVIEARVEIARDQESMKEEDDQEANKIEN